MSLRHHYNNTGSTIHVVRNEEGEKASELRTNHSAKTSSRMNTTERERNNDDEKNRARAVKNRNGLTRLPRKKRTEQRFTTAATLHRSLSTSTNDNCITIHNTLEATFMHQPLFRSGLKRKFRMHGRSSSNESASSVCGSTVSSLSSSSVLTNDSTHTPKRMSNTVALGAGCFCETERFFCDVFRRRFPGAVRDVRVGFASPYTTGVHQNPTFEQVHRTGKTGHIEVVLVELEDPERNFEDLIRFFFQMHDPTTLYRQNCHRGFQFSSWVFCGDDSQAKIVRKIRIELQDMINDGDLWGVFESNKVKTGVSPLRHFTPAPEDYHSMCVPTIGTSQQNLDDSSLGQENQQPFGMRFDQWAEICAGGPESESLSSTRRHRFQFGRRIKQ